MKISAITPETRTIKKGVIISFYANGIWNRTRATKHLIRAAGVINDYGMFEFKLTIGSTLRDCKVDYTELM